MHELTISQLSLVAGGKTASGGKSPGGFSGVGMGTVNVNTSANVSTENKVNTNINITCNQQNGSIVYKESWGGLVKELQCATPAPSSSAPSSARGASSPATGNSSSNAGKLQAFYWQDGSIT